MGGGTELKRTEGMNRKKAKQNESKKGGKVRGRMREERRRREL